MLLTIATAMGAIAVIDNAAGLVPAGLRWPVRMAAVVLAVIGLSMAMRRRPRDRNERRTAPDGCGPSRQDILDSANLVLAAYPAAPAAPDPVFAFTQLLVEGGHVSRITEDVRLTGDLLAIDVTIEVSLEALRHGIGNREALLPESGRFVIPIMRRKEFTLESFEARDGTDERLVTLPQRLTDGWLAWAIKSLYELTYLPGGGTPTAAQRKQLYRILELVCRSDVIASDEFYRRYDAIVAERTASSGPDLLRSICGYFAGNTVSAIEVDAETTSPLIVRYSYLATADRLDAVNTKIRTRLGIRPYRYYTPINLAYEADIYDLRFTGPESHFVFRHFLRHGTAQPLEPTALTSGSGTGARLEENAGTPSAGVHTRGLNRSGSRPDVQCVVEFEEIPPGALRRALVISAVCTLTTGAFAFAVPTAVMNSKGTDMAALLLAAPGLAATFVGLTTDRVQQSSLTTFGGLAVSASLSFLASALYVLESLLWPDPPLIRISMLELVNLPPADSAWLCVATLSLCTTIYLTVEDAYRTRRYLATLRGRSISNRSPTRVN